MKKSTKNILIGIGILSILSGFYGIYNGSGWDSTLPALFIGITLIGTTYLEKAA